MGYQRDVCASLALELVAIFADSDEAVGDDLLRVPISKGALDAETIENGFWRQ